MPKLVLDTILRDKPLNNSILVYDEKRDAFVEVHKDDFFKERDNEIRLLKETIKEQNTRLDKFSKQMSQMAKIIKERVI